MGTSRVHSLEELLPFDGAVLPGLVGEHGGALEADASLLLASAPNLEMGLQHLARLCVADLADLCTVDLLPEEGSQMRRVAVACAHEELHAVARALEEHAPSLGRATGPGRVARAGPPEWLEEQPEQVLDALAEGPEDRALLGHFHLVSSLCVPLAGRERRVGALWLGTVEGGRRLQQADVALALGLGRRAGLAIEAAERQEALRHQLQAREQELRETQSLLTSAPVGLAVLDSQLRVVRMNPALGELTGTSPVAVVGRPLLEAFPTAAPSLLPAAHQVLGSGSAVGELRVEGPPDAPAGGRPWRASLHPLPPTAGSPGGLALVGVAEPPTPHRPPAQLHALPGGRAAPASRTHEPTAARASAEQGWYTTLRTSEERFRALVLATSQLLWTTDPVGLVVEDSPSWRAFTGQRWEEFRGAGWLEAVHPEDRKACMATWEAAVASQSRYDFEYRLRGRDGSYRLFSVHAVPLRGADGTVKEWVGASTDITESALASRRTELLAALSGALSGALTASQVVETVVEHALGALGASAGALVRVEGEGELSTMHSAGFPPGLFAVGASLSAGEKAPVMEAVRRRELVLVRSRELLRRLYPELFAATGEVGHRALAVSPLLVRGTACGVLVLAFRTTQDFEPAERVLLRAQAGLAAQALERARLYDAEHAARTDAEAAQRRLAFLAEASAALSSDLDAHTILERLARLAVLNLSDICVVDVVNSHAETQRVEVSSRQPERQEEVEALRAFTQPLAGNTPAARVMRSGRTEFVPELTREYLAAQDFQPEHRERILALHPTSLLVVPLLARGEVRGALTLVMSGSARHFGPGDVVLAEELARRAALALENAWLYREAQQAIRTRDAFLAVASHELQTPLTPLALHLSRLERLGAEAARAPPDPERLQGAVAAAQRQLWKLRDLIRTLLDASLFTLEPQAVTRERVDLAELVREVAASWAPQAARAGCALQVDAAAPVVGLWDRGRLEQVVTCLLSNALRFGAGAPVHLRAWTEGGVARLQVKDEGIGIAPENHQRIFERFERAVSERNYGGLGLGLFLARRTVVALGGRIWVASQTGQGATFTVELPRGAVEAVPQADQRQDAHG